MRKNGWMEARGGKNEKMHEAGGQKGGKEGKTNEKEGRKERRKDKEIRMHRSER